jgi:hypothetical protein
MPTDHDPDQILQRHRSPQHNALSPLRPQGVVSLEALGRLAQEIARILQRLRAEGPGRVNRVRRGN